MLNAEDQDTFLAVRELARSIRESKKPLIFWIGAGASKWLDYPYGENLRAIFDESSSNMSAVLTMMELSH
jgi:hypothetical protein